jgi:hypothetical protein
MRTVTPTPQVATELILDVALTQSAQRAWASFHICVGDGSWWPAATGRSVLAALVSKFGVLGTIGISRVSDTEGETIVSDFAQTPESARALAAAANAISEGCALAVGPATTLVN